MLVSPDGLSVEGITQKLGTHFIGQRVIHLASVDSTMDVIAAEVRRGTPEGLTVIADLQTAGRGRFQRAWLSRPCEGIHLSLLLRPAPREYGAVNMAASLAVVEAARVVAGVTASIKWPNDIQVGGHKLSGILIEAATAAENSYVILGVGINVSLRPDMYPEIATIATSLTVEAGRPITRLPVLRVFLESFERRYLRRAEDAELAAEWRSKLNTLGKDVNVTWQPTARAKPTVVSGTAIDVTTAGALVVRRKNGSVVEVVAGEVMLRE